MSAIGAVGSSLANRRFGGQDTSFEEEKPWPQSYRILASMLWTDSIFSFIAAQTLLQPTPSQKTASQQLMHN